MARRRNRTPSGTNLFLVRHGVTDSTGKVLYGRSNDVHLSDEGKAQAEEAGRRLAEVGEFAHLAVSPLARTRETAEPIAAATGLDPTRNRQFTEVDFGDWVNRPLADLFKDPDWPRVQRTPSQYRFPNGESFVEVQTRMVTATEDLVAAHRGSDVIVVSHADPLKTLLAHYAGMPLDSFQRLVISPGSISVVHVTPDGAAVLTTNSTGGDLAKLRLS